MTEDFDLTPHRRYRRREIHNRWGGQQQGGISTPVSIPAVFVFSGPTGKRFGYDQDEGWQPDGTFQDTGEGQRGPMALERGSRRFATTPRAERISTCSPRVLRGAIGRSRMAEPR